MNIKAVAFDYGGVICYFPSPQTIAETASLCGLTAETFQEINRKYRDEWDNGKYKGPEYYRHILSTINIFPDNETLDKLTQADMDCWKRINQDTVRLMRDIKAACIGLGVLSNMPHDFLAWARQNIPVLSETDAAVFSCEHGIIKPEAAIYEKLRNSLGCEFKEIVFFDDLADNIKKARELGIHGFIWEGAEAARETLKGLGGMLKEI